MAMHIKDLLNSFFKEAEKKNKEKDSLQKIIDRVLAEKVRKHVHLKKTYKNKLIFQSDSSSFSYEFNLKKKELLEEIQKENPEIEKIQVVIG
jgi:hypothetical protein